MTKGICQGASVSDDLCISEQSHDNCAEAGRKHSVWVLDATTLPNLPETSNMRIDKQCVEY